MSCNDRTSHAPDNVGTDPDDAIKSLVQGDDLPPAPEERVVETLVYDDEGNPEIQQVEESSGQYRMHFVGLGD